MKKTTKGIALFLSLNMVLFCLPARAVDLGSMGLNVPNIQGVGASEKSSPQARSGTGMETVMESPIDEQSYRLGPGDQLAVHMIVGDAELSIDHNLLVGADGKVFFPNIGEIYLSGLNMAQAKQKIDSSIRNVYREYYKLSVMLSQPKKVKIYLSGMVKNPGPLAVYDNSRISEVVSLAGGVASGASNRYVYIKRKNAEGGDKIILADLFEAYRGRDLSKDIRIQAGDLVEIPDASNERVSLNKASGEKDKLLFEGKETFVYVYGEVASRGRFEYIPGRKLSDYISYAGGPSERAVLSSVTVTRQINGKPEKYSINVSDILYNGSSMNDIEIMGGDVINIPKNFFYFSDFPSFVNTVLLAFTLYATLATR